MRACLATRASAAPGAVRRDADDRWPHHASGRSGRDGGDSETLANFQIETAITCVGGAAAGLSGGDVFLIIFFVGGFSYIAIGMLIKRQRFQAQGWDLVPNIDFWRELPSLMKDGFRFVYQKCCVRA